MTLDVSVIICAYARERWNDLVTAVDSIRSQTAAPGEIVVVIDHNPDLLTFARTYLPDVQVVGNPGEQGVSGARNAGAIAARGHVIAFLDDDAVAESNWLEALTDHFADPRVLGVGGWVWPIWEGGRPRWFPEEFNWVIGASYRGMPTEVQQVRNPFGGCMCIRSDVFRAVGGFLPSMGTTLGPTGGACEEVELCVRAQERFPGGVFLFEPRGAIRHKVPSSRATLRYLRTRCYTEGGSKALVRRLAVRSDVLETERAYVTRTLRCGITRNMKEFILHGDIAGLGRATTIGIGLFYTGLGYLRAEGSVPNWYRIDRPVNAQMQTVAGNENAEGTCP